MTKNNNKESILNQSLESMDENMIWAEHRKQKIGESISYKMNTKSNFFKTKTHVLTPRILMSISSFLLIGIVTLLLTNMIYETESQNLSQGSNKSIFELIGKENLQRVVEEGDVREISLTIENDQFKMTIEQAYYDQNELALSYKISVIEPIKDNLEQLVLLDKTFELRINGEVQDELILESYSLNSKEDVIQGILIVEVPNNFPDKISVELESKEIIKEKIFMFDVSKANINDDF